MKTVLKKQVILLNPGLADPRHIRLKLVGSRLCCSEIEISIADDIYATAKKAIYFGTICDLTEIFTRKPVRYGDRDTETIKIPNEVLVNELMSRVFKSVEETDKHIYIILTE